MQLQKIALLFLLSTIISCKDISFQRKNIQPIDTVIDFSKVDTAPFFKECNELLSNEKRKCFGAYLHDKIANELMEFPFETKDSIDEEIKVILLINNTGKVTLLEIQASDFVMEKLPNLVPILRKATENLLELEPATKRGIPVSTQYTLPIKIITN